MSELPAGWAETTLGEVANTQLGKMLSQKAKGGANPKPYLRNRNVQWGRFDLADVLTMDFSEAELTKFRLQPGDLIVCEGGEVGRAAVWRGQLDECYFQKALHRIRPRQGVMPEYLLYLLWHLAASDGLAGSTSGSTIAHLPQEDLRRIRVPLAPLVEQRRIVEAIEEHLSRINGAESSLASAIQKLGHLRTSRIRAVLSGNWPMARVGDVAAVDSGPAFRSSHFRSAGEGIPLLRGENIEPGRLRWRETRSWPESMLAGYEHLLIADSDIILGMDRPVVSAGLKLASVTSADLPALLVQRVARIRAGGEVTPGYLRLALSHPEFVRHLLRGQTGTQLPHITLASIRSFLIPLPPVAEQQRIALDFGEIVDREERIRRVVDEALRRAAALRRSVLHGAFTGSLTPAGGHQRLQEAPA